MMENVITFRNLYRTLGRLVFCVLITATAALITPAQAPANDAAQASTKAASASSELSEGVAAYKNGQYDAAIEHFQRAVELDPDSVMAKTYLATALAQNLVPGLNTPDNLKIAQQAIDVFQQVLEKNPGDVNSMKQVAGIYFSVGKLDDAKAWQKRVLSEDPANPEAAYTIGVIDWQESHQNAQAALQKAGFNDDGQGNAGAPKKVLEAIKAQNAALVAEALQYLSDAMQSRPKYTDAMEYLNLVYRRKADLDWDDPAASKDDIAKAQEWARKAMETRRSGHGSAQP
jgi:tetratricopeptide (TPR) repeat protein